MKPIYLCLLLLPLNLLHFNQGQAATSDAAPKAASSKQKEDSSLHLTFDDFEVGHPEFTKMLLEGVQRNRGLAPWIDQKIEEIPHEARLKNLKDFLKLIEMARTVSAMAKELVEKKSVTDLDFTSDPFLDAMEREANRFVQKKILEEMKERKKHNAKSMFKTKIDSRDFYSVHLQVNPQFNASLLKHYILRSSLFQYFNIKNGDSYNFLSPESLSSLQTFFFQIIYGRRLHTIATSKPKTEPIVDIIERLQSEGYFLHIFINYSPLFLFENLFNSLAANFKPYRSATFTYKDKQLDGLINEYYAELSDPTLSQDPENLKRLVEKYGPLQEFYEQFFDQLAEDTQKQINELEEVQARQLALDLPAGATDFDEDFSDLDEPQAQAAPKKKVKPKKAKKCKTTKALDPTPRALTTTVQPTLEHLPVAAAAATSVPRPSLPKNTFIRKGFRIKFTLESPTVDPTEGKTDFMERSLMETRMLRTYAGNEKWKAHDLLHQIPQSIIEQMKSHGEFSSTTTYHQIPRAPIGMPLAATAAGTGYRTRVARVEWDLKVRGNIMIWREEDLAAGKKDPFLQLRGDFELGGIKGHGLIHKFFRPHFPRGARRQTHFQALQDFRSEYVQKPSRKAFKSTTQIPDDAKFEGEVEDGAQGAAARGAPIGVRAADVDDADDETEATKTKA